jgi:hypothetical protein
MRRFASYEAQKTPSLQAPPNHLFESQSLGEDQHRHPRISRGLFQTILGKAGTQDAVVFGNHDSDSDGFVPECFKRYLTRHPSDREAGPR